MQHVNAAQEITCSSAGELHHGKGYPLKPTMRFEYLYLNLGKWKSLFQPAQPPSQPPPGATGPAAAAAAAPPPPP